MGTVSHRQYWPYDEVLAERGRALGHYVFSAPWIQVEVEVDTALIDRADRVVRRISWGDSRSENLNEAIDDATWLFSSISEYPLTYVLPAPPNFSARDLHRLRDKSYVEASPRSMLLSLAPQSEKRGAFERVAEGAFDPTLGWKWDMAAALTFAETGKAYDPVSLFTVARRFHLLESVENDQTERLVQLVRGLRHRSEEFREAAALIVRQNHYVTQKCDSALRPALEIAQSARVEVGKFIRAESGHDRLLERALTELGMRPESVSVSDCVVVLMEVFTAIAQRNFLAFSIVVDIFERSSYCDEDPLATLLNDGGHSAAGKHIDLHREINDSGAHENIGIGFLGFMASVDADYATEALRFAELTTRLIHLVSSSVIEKIRK